MLWRMKTKLLLCVLAAGLVSQGAEFEKPVLLKADGAPVEVEQPGYACPTWADWDGDGKADLLVGQFNKGKIHFFKNLGGEGVPKLAKGEWIMADGKPAEVPGVW